MMAKGLRLLRFEFDIAGSPLKCVAVTEDTVEDKDEARKYIFDKVIQQKGDAENIALNGISDYGLLTFFSPGVVDILEKYFNSQKLDFPVGQFPTSKEEQKKRPSLEKKK